MADSIFDDILNQAKVREGKKKAEEERLRKELLAKERAEEERWRHLATQSVSAKVAANQMAHLSSMPEPQAPQSQELPRNQRRAVYGDERVANGAQVLPQQKPKKASALESFEDLMAAADRNSQQQNPSGVVIMDKETMALKKVVEKAQKPVSSDISRKSSVDRSVDSKSSGSQSTKLSTLQSIKAVVSEPKYLGKTSTRGVSKDTSEWPSHRPLPANTLSAPSRLHPSQRKQQSLPSSGSKLVRKGPKNVYESIITGSKPLQNRQTTAASGTGLVMLNQKKRDLRTIEEIQMDMEAKKRQKQDPNATGSGSVNHREKPKTSILPTRSERQIALPARPPPSSVTSVSKPLTSAASSKQKLPLKSSPKERRPSGNERPPKDSRKSTEDRARPATSSSSTSITPRNAANLDDPDYIQNNVSSVIRQLMMRPETERRLFHGDFRDDDFDDAAMETSARDLEIEERRTARIGRLEDKREELRLQQEEEERRRRKKRLKQKKQD